MSGAEAIEPITHVWAFLGYDDSCVAIPGEPCCAFYTLSRETVPLPGRYPKEEVRRIAVCDLPDDQRANIVDSAINNEALIRAKRFRR